MAPPEFPDFPSGGDYIAPKDGEEPAISTGGQPFGNLWSPPPPVHTGQPCEDDD